MDRYASLSPYGRHRGPAALDAAAVSQEVRGEPAPDTTGQSSYALYRGTDGSLELSPYAEGSPAREGYDEVGRYASVAEAMPFTREMGFVVLENTASGEKHVAPAADFSGALDPSSGFDRARFFPTPDAAEAYAKAG